MQKIVLLALGLLFLKQGFSQQTDLDSFNLQRQKINKKGLLVIGSWSAANIIYGGLAASHQAGSVKFFNRMNAVWNTVTLGLSAIGYLTAKKDQGQTFAQSLTRQVSIEKVFLLNVGLDAAYVAGGFYLQERSHNNLQNADKLKGYGQSIILQGSVLFVFDTFMYLIHNKHGKVLHTMAEKVTFASTENGVGLILKL